MSAAWMRSSRCTCRDGCRLIVSRRALLEADGQYALWTSPTIDVTTGEAVVLEDEDLGDARSA